MRWVIAGACMVVQACAHGPVPSADSSAADWPYYAGDAGGSRYSMLAQINKTDVSRLRIA